VYVSSFTKTPVEWPSGDNLFDLNYISSSSSNETCDLFDFEEDFILLFFSVSGKPLNIVSGTTGSSNGSSILLSKENSASKAD